MEEDRVVVFQELQDLHGRLADCYDLVEGLLHGPGLNAELDEALAGLHFSVAEAAQNAGRLLGSPSLWESP